MPLVSMLTTIPLHMQPRCIVYEYNLFKRLRLQVSLSDDELEYASAGRVSSSSGRPPARRARASNSGGGRKVRCSRMCNAFGHLICAVAAAALHAIVRICLLGQLSSVICKALHAPDLRLATQSTRLQQWRGTQGALQRTLLYIWPHDLGNVAVAALQVRSCGSPC